MRAPKINPSTNVIILPHKANGPDIKIPTGSNFKNSIMFFMLFVLKTTPPFYEQLLPLVANLVKILEYPNLTL